MHYHLIGVEGISMKGLKQLLIAEGNEVTGSDLKLSGHNQENITKDIDVVVRTSAVSPGSPGWVEVLAAEKKGIRVIKRSRLIGEITKDKFLITISGMHGKTTVTSLIGLILIEAGLDPTVLIGEKIKEFDWDVLKIGKSKYFVLEACEYDRSFLDFRPTISVITNIDEEHLDTYPGGIKEITETFSAFTKNIKQGGTLVYYKADKNLLKVAEKVRPDIEKIPYPQEGSSDKVSGLKLIGEHNKINAMAAYTVAKKLNVSDEIVSKVFKSFAGAKRRLEFKGEFNGALIYDDYGHHPTEIAATIAALREKYPEKKIITVFWPHQYKRIKPLINKFSTCFSESDEVILKPIFFVPGRDSKEDVSSEMLKEKIKNNGQKVEVMESDEKIVQYLKDNITAENIVLTIGIPPVYKIADTLME